MSDIKNNYHLVPSVFIPKNNDSEEIIKYIDYILYELRIYASFFQEKDYIDFINLSIDNYNSLHKRCILHNTRRFIFYTSKQIIEVKNKKEKK